MRRGRNSRREGKSERERGRENYQTGRGGEENLTKKTQGGGKSKCQQEGDCILFARLNAISM